MRQRAVDSDGFLWCVSEEGKRGGEEKGESENLDGSAVRGRGVRTVMSCSPLWDG